jgi:hypothetical protein
VASVEGRAFRRPGIRRRLTESALAQSGTVAGKAYQMKLFIFPPSARVLAVVALKDCLDIDCEVVPIDLSKGDQRRGSVDGGVASLAPE